MSDIHGTRAELVALIASQSREIVRLTEALVEWKQAAGVEAGLRREFMSEIERISALWIAETRAVERQRAALDQCMRGGNHIANWRSARWPDYKLDGLTREQQAEHAMRTLGAGREYDMWCCWSAIMQARDSLALPREALEAAK